MYPETFVIVPRAGLRSLIPSLPFLPNVTDHGFHQDWNLAIEDLIGGPSHRLHYCPLDFLLASTPVAPLTVPASGETSISVIGVWSLVGAGHQPVGQFLGNETPELALTFLQGVGRDVSLTGPAGDGFLIHTDEFTGFSRVEKSTLRQYVSVGHEGKYRGGGAA